MRRSGFAALSFLALAVLLVFLILPIVAIFTHTGPNRLVDALGEKSAREALRLSFETSAIAMLLIVAIGTPAAWLVARRDFPGRAVILTLIELPLIVPPAVAGLALLAAF
ncbi:MAG TPA: molybdate ABC transporter permease subunit, partial [Solirubrobacterales bacterium]